MNTLEQNKHLLLPVFALASVIYILSSPFTPYLFSPLVKVFPILLLVVLAGVNLTGKVRTLMMLALVLSGTGDVLLAIEFSNSFVFGLGAFLCAHIVYMLLFARFTGKTHAMLKLVGCAIVLLYAAFMLTKVLPEQTVMRVAVMCYLSVISLMTIVAIWCAKATTKFFVIGAVIFVISDSFIAWNMFHSPIAHNSYWVMSTYYLAQFLILLGVTQASRELTAVAQP